MKKFIVLLSLHLFIVACTPVPTRTVFPTATPVPSKTSTVSDQAAATLEPSPVVQSQAEPTKKNKGEKPLVAPTSTSKEFIAYEITGRPTDSSVTVNVVPAVPMIIFYVRTDRS